MSGSMCLALVCVFGPLQSEECELSREAEWDLSGKVYRGFTQLAVSKEPRSQAQVGRRECAR